MPSGIETFGNFPVATVTTNTTSGTTSVSVNETTGTTWPVADATVTPNTFFHIIDPAQPSEIMLVTAAAGGTGFTAQGWTIARGQEGTTAVSHGSNWTAQQVISAGTMQNLKQASNSAVSAVTIANTTNESVLAVYNPVAADLEAGATFEVVAFGPLAKQTSGQSIQFAMYWGGSGTVGGTYTIGSGTQLAMLRTGTNAVALAGTTLTAGSSFDVNGSITLLSTTSATANLNMFYNSGTGALSTAQSTATTTNTATATPFGASGTPKTIAGSGPVFLTAKWATAATTSTLTATAPLIYRCA